MTITPAEARIAEIRERAEAAIADYKQECENASDAGERIDLWEDVVEIHIADITDLFAALDAARIWHDKAHKFLSQRNDFLNRALAAEAERDENRRLYAEAMQRWRDSSEQAQQVWLEERDRAEKAEAERDKLKAALEPLAALAEAYDPVDEDDDDILWDRSQMPTVGMIRAARAALAQEPS
jgi:hypothetical protein